MQKKTYYVADGVGTINGLRVPASRKVRLNEREALYDLSLGRLSATKPKPVRKDDGEGEGTDA